jgi:diacylglycerol kinase (ATP)
MGNKETIVLLINPSIQNKRAKKIVLEIIAVLSERQIRFTSYTYSWPEDLNSYKEVWIIGGDGTLNYFLNLYRHIHIPIAIFRAGTGNDFAWSLYGALSASQQAKYLLTATLHWVDAATCNEHVFINGAGIGFDGEVVRSIKSIRWIGGHLGYLFAVMKQIFIFKEPSLRVEYEGNIIEDIFLLCLICNSSRMGGGFKVSPESKTDDGFLNLVLCRQLTLFNRLRYLPIIDKGQHLHLGCILHSTVSKVNVSCNKSLYIQLDGELHSGKFFNITVMPKRYLFRY